MGRGYKIARKTLTPKGAATRERLLTVAKRVFEQSNCYETSVAEICRRARVANGTFYQYFKDKEALVLELATRLSEALRTELAASLKTDGDLDTRLGRAFNVFVTFIRENRTLYQIFREIEFVHKRTHNRFYNGLTKIFARCFAEAYRQGVLRPVDVDVAAVAVIGVLHFLVLQWLILGPGDVPEDALQGAVELILHGIDSGRPIRTGSPRPPAPPPLAETPHEPPLTRGEETRRKLLQAAEICFSHKGFYATSVADITRRAGVSLGAYYLYFPSKTEILAELVRDINGRLRRNARAATAGLRDRREIEREGLRAFFRFVSQNMEAYRIVREAEFVDPQIARWYFEQLALGYIKGLQEGMRRREIRHADAETLAYALMGISHFLGLRWAAWSKHSPLPEHVFAHAIDLILHGLKKPPAG